MSRPAIQYTELNPHLTLSKCHPDSECRTINWWLFDTRAGMNIAMRETSQESAFVEAIEYWACRALECEAKYNALQKHVDAFIEQVNSREEEEENY